MTKNRMTENLARSIGWDAGNRSMSTAGRTKWSLKDYSIAANEYNKLMDVCELNDMS